MHKRHVHRLRLDVVCETRAHCVACRNDPVFRKNVASACGLDDDYNCPFGYEWGLRTPPPAPDPPVNTRRPDIKPVPRDQWPRWARMVAQMRAGGDSGVGDTINRKLGRLGSVFKATLKLFGAPCGCEHRQRELNLAYPYPPVPDE